MAFLFLDTSAFLKLYKVEKGSGWLTNFIAGQDVYISKLAIAESATALGGLYRSSNLSRKDASSIFGQLYNEQAKYNVLDLVLDDQLSRIIQFSFNLPANLRIRALDAIQLATAYLVWDQVRQQPTPQTFIFVSSDAQLIHAAQALGFATENPEDHP